MIQFNLLPDIKLEYIKAKRSKHTVMVVSVLVGGASLAVLVILFMTVAIFQKKHLSDLNKDITNMSSELKGTPDINKILTVQNQLNSLPALLNGKPVVSRLFGYITSITPSNTSISKFDVDFSKQLINIQGDADTLETVNKFVDTIKFTTYSTADGNTKDQNAFSSVVLASYGRTDKGATYQITLNYDQAIFDSTKKVTLTVPKIITTRSELEKPGDLFKATPSTSNTSGGATQ